MEELPLVSLCIPTYNGELFIQAALASIVTQTYPQLEVIISDDGSGDRTLVRAENFLMQSNLKFSIHPHPCYGIAGNCNHAASKAQGKYIKFLFQDDLLRPNCIAALVTLAEEDEEIGLVFSDREMLFSSGSETDPDLQTIYRDFQRVYQGWTTLDRIQPGSELLKDPQLLHHPINKIGEPSTVLLRRSAFWQVGGFDPRLNQLVDLDLWLRILTRFKAGFVDQVLSGFRLHPQQKTYQNIRNQMATDWNFYWKVYHHSDYDSLQPDFRYQALWIYTVNFIGAYIRGQETSISQRMPLEHLRRIRFWVARDWLKCSDQNLQTLYDSDFRKVHRILSRNKQLKTEPLMTFEEYHVNSLLQFVAQNQLKAIPAQILLSLELYPTQTSLPFLKPNPKIS
ncbi:MAG: glycosyltransferase [Oscillatoriales cyanobacterium SM2_3_0]|nr:glycosyltransferase [Oscillatoriales cyanobacterium SM2_3_0]